MPDRCYECSAPVPPGNTYCPKCEAEDDTTKQIPLIKNTPNQTK